MKKIVFFIVSFITISACTDKDAIRRAEAKKAEIKREEVFEAISKNWNFRPADFTEESYNIVQQWAEWNIFYNELLQKPQTDIGAFQRKTVRLVKQSEDLQSTIPEIFNVIQIQTRFTVLETKLKMLKTYITLDEIPTEDVIRTVSEANTEVESIVSRMKTILDRQKIEREEGEIEMLKSLQQEVQPENEIYEDIRIQSN